MEQNSVSVSDLQTGHTLNSEHLQRSTLARHETNEWTQSRKTGVGSPLSPWLSHTMAPHLQNRRQEDGDTGQREHQDPGDSLFPGTRTAERRHSEAAAAGGRLGHPKPPVGSHLTPRNCGCSPGALDSLSILSESMWAMEMTVAATYHGRPMKEQAAMRTPTQNRSR